jgi:hypothetical protein
MKASPTTLLGSALAFDRAGRALIVAEPDAISVVDLVASRTARLPLAAARAVAGFDDQIWIATSDDRLLRVDHAGRSLGEPLPLPFAARAVLEPAPCGPPAAIWASSPPVALIDDFGQLRCTELADADLTLPLTGRRLVTVRGTRITLPSSVVVPLPPNTGVLGGAVMADGKFATLLVAQAAGRQLLTISLSTGQVSQRSPLFPAAVRVATHRHLAVAQLEPRLLAARDLHAGRDLGRIRLDDDADDFAIDTDGQRLAVRSPGGAIEVHRLIDVLRPAGASRAVPPREPEQAAIAEPAPPPAPDLTDPEGAGAAAEPRDAAGDDCAGDDRADDDRAATDDDRAFPPDVQLALLASRRPVARGSAPTLASPYATAVLHTPLTSASLVALDPRTRPPVIDRGEARGQLDLERRTVALWALAAIAAAWDSRKLGYGNEGKHPYELEVGAILGMNAGFATDYLEAARDKLAEHEQVIAQHRRWRTRDTPIGALIEELALDPLAVDIVLVVAAAALWGEIARLYGILANDAGRPTVDELLVEELLARRHDRHAIAAALDARAPLVRLGVVHVTGPRARPFAGLAVDPVVLDRLRAVAPDLGPAIALRTAERELADLDVPRATLDAALAALARTPAADGAPHAGARIVLRGRLGSGRRTLACALAAQAGRDLAVIDATALPRAADRFLAELRQSLRRAQLAGAIPCLVQLADVTFDAQPARELAVETLRLHPGPIVLVTAPDDDVPFGAGHVAVELPVLAESARQAVWRRALAEAGVTVASVDALAARYKIGPGVIRRAIAAAAATADASPDGASPDDATPAIEAYIRQTRDSRLAQYARRVERLASWSSVVLPADVLDSLRELVARVRHGRLVYETWGMSRTMSTSRGLTALFQGQPGTGKTLVAGVIARELGLDLYQVDLSKVMSKWIGETERNLATIFDAAEDGQVVLLFDEADSLFAKRTEVRSSNDRYANLEVNYLLQRLDAFGGIAILTTNSGSTIDQAFKRRLSFRLSFPFPDEETREQLWRAHLPPELPLAGPLTLDALARKYQLSGGYIRNACLRAAFLAAQDETSLHQHHLERAVALEFAELGKLSNSGAID